MEIYLVGGAVRDFLLLRSKHSFLSSQEEQHYWDTVEKDWVVVGATPAEMLALGYRQVGKSFPVFLHPTSQEEYALARTERKVGKGYTGFECFSDPSVTLEQDLQRRDLTINALAMKFGKAGEKIIDPYGGVQDLQNKVFRHVSDAFVEDPVRILRVARFASRFGDFQIAPETLTLMKRMVENGEIDALVPERVWQEWQKSLQEKAPWRWFEVLEQCGAKSRIFRHVNHLSLKKAALKLAIDNKLNEIARLTLQLYDLEEDQLLELIKTYRIPNDYSDLVMLMNKFYKDYAANDWSPENLLNFFEKTDAFRRNVRFHEFVRISDLLSRIEERAVKAPDFDYLLTELMKINNEALLKAGFKGALFAKALRKARLDLIAKKLNWPGWDGSIID